MPALRIPRRLAPHVLLLAVVGLDARAAAAQGNNHFLSASCGSGSPVGESTFDPEVDSVEAQWADGVPGTAGGGRELSASADSASGLMRARGVSDDTLNGSRTRAGARIDQRVRPNDGGDFGPVTLVVSLGVSSGGDVRARNSASLEVGTCNVSLTDEIGGSAPGVTTAESGCNDSPSIDWTTSAGPSGITIQADYASRPSAVYLVADVLGYLGNGTTDIPTGSFSIIGRLAVQQAGGELPPTFASESFLTVPEPGGSALALAACGALAASARRGRS